MSPGGASLARLYTPERHRIPEMVSLKQLRDLQDQYLRESHRDRHDPIVAQRDLQDPDRHAYTDAERDLQDSDCSKCMQNCIFSHQDLQDPDRDPSMQNCLADHHDLQDPDRDPNVYSYSDALHALQDLQDRHDLSMHICDDAQRDQDSVMQSCKDVYHMHSRWQRVVFLKHDKWSADEDIMLKWQLVAKLVNARMNVYDPQDVVSKWERLGFQMRNKEYRWNV